MLPMHSFSPFTCSFIMIYTMDCKGSRICFFEISIQLKSGMLYSTAGSCIKLFSVTVSNEATQVGLLLLNNEAS